MNDTNRHVTPIAVLMACNADRWTTRTHRARKHIYITSNGLEYRS